MTEPKILYLDIEVSPTVFAGWSLFKPVFNIQNIIEHPRILGVAYMKEGWKRAKWVSEFSHPDGRTGMLQTIYDLVSEADVLVGYNSQRFDWTWLKSEFAVEGFAPPPEVRHVDLFKIVKQNFRFVSNKLDYVSMRLMNERKEDAGGMETWLGCMRGDRDAWALMGRYARRDVDLLPALYKKLLPWANTGQPNMATLAGVEGLACTACTSTNFTRRGYYTTNAGRYQRYQCSDCGRWFRGVNRVSTTEGR